MPSPPQLNDPYLQAILDSYGDGGVAGSGFLVQGIQPVVMADEYRSEMRFTTASFLPTGLLPSLDFKVKGDPLLNTRFIAGHIGIAGAGSRTRIEFRTTFTTANGTAQLIRGSSIVDAGAQMAVLGSMAKDGAITEFETTPFDVLVPPGESLFVTIVNDAGGNVPAALISLVLQAVTEAPTRAQVHVAATDIVGV